MGRRQFDLLVVATLAVLAVGVALAGEEAGPWRALLTVPLVLFLPGYALELGQGRRRDGGGVPVGVRLSQLDVDPHRRQAAGEAPVDEDVADAAPAQDLPLLGAQVG